jgi:hypothetical protein
MKTLATIVRTIAYIGIAPLLPMIAITWVLALLCSEDRKEAASEVDRSVSLQLVGIGCYGSQLSTLGTAV